MNDSLDLLDRAKAIVQSRQNSYRSPEKSFAQIAHMWSVIFDKPITSEQVALALLALKVVRELAAHQEDNLLDMIGYVLCLDSLV